MADKIPGESIIRVIASNTETKQDHKQGHEPATEGKKLILSLQNPEFDTESSIKDLEDILKNNKRILYSVFTEYVYGNYSGDKIDLLQNNIRKLMEACENDQQKALVVKIEDHVHLAVMQISRIEEINNALNGLTDKEKDDLLKHGKETVAKIEKLKAETFEKMEEAKTGTITLLVSLLSIFTAAAFVLFGGISGLSGLFGLLGNPLCSLGKIIIGVATYGLMMLIVLFVLYWFVKKLVNPPKRQEK